MNEDLCSKGSVPTAPIHEYVHNSSRGYIVDLLYTLQYHILAHPERSSHIKYIPPSFRADGGVYSIQHTELVLQ